MIKSLSSSHTGADLKINLETNHIILHGSTDEAAGVMLRGSVVLNCHENLKVKGISLKFAGHLHVHWVEGPSQRHYKDKKTIMEEEWQFLPKSHKVHHFDKGEQYHYDFELALPGHLPSTFHHDIGSLIYSFKAQVDRPTFSPNYISTRELRIIHTPQLNSQLTAQQQPQEINNLWADKVAYRIYVPSQVYWTGASIPVTFDIKPLCDHLEVQSIQMVLKEYIRFRANDHQSTEKKVIATFCDKHFIQRAIPLALPNNSRTGWSKTETIIVPDNQSIGRRHQHLASNVDFIHADLESEFIDVYHKLKVTVAFSNPDGHISELRVSVPLSLVELVPEEDATVLPAYEDAWRTAPYYPAAINDIDIDSPISSVPTSLRESQQSIRNSCASSASFSSASSADVDDDDEIATSPLDPLPWMGVDLSRVPSYTTALRTGRLYSYSGNSLPAYDSIAPATSA
ncbi:unnamed protein product [Absidia cylindrospora]